MPSARRFPPPWTADEANAACFIVKDHNGYALAYVYLADPGRAPIRTLPQRKFTAVDRVPNFRLPRGGDIGVRADFISRRNIPAPSDLGNRRVSATPSKKSKSIASSTASKTS